MQSFILKIRSWKLFLLFVFAPLVLAEIYELITLTFTSFGNPRIFDSVWIFIMYLIYLTWIYSIANHFTKQLGKTPKYLKLSFTLSLFYNAYYSFFVMGHIHTIAETAIRTFSHFLIQMLFMVGYIYILYHASKALREVELKREVAFRDAFADFLCFLMFPIGLWFVQSRVRKLFKLQKVET